MSATNSTDISPSQSPINSHNAPKFGTLVPNRIFVGGIPGNTTEEELFQLFTVFGKVKATKIIVDRAGVSKGYGFITFENEDDAKRVQKEENITLKDRKLNIAPAIRKQPFSRVYGSPEAPTERLGTPRQPRNSGDWSVVSSVATTPSTEPAPYVPNGTVFYHSTGASYYNPNGVIFTSGDGTCQFAPPQALYPVMYSPTAVYIPQQYPSYQSPTAAQAHWTGQPLCWTSHLGYGQTSGSSFATTLPAVDGLPYVPTPPSFLPNVSPHASASTSTASAPQYVYNTNSGITTSTTSPSHANNNNVSTTVTSLQPQNIGEPACAVSTPIPAAAVAYSYPPPPIITPYPSANGDVIDMSMMEASAEQTQHTQDSASLVKPCTAGLNAVVRFVHAFPHQDIDEYHLPYFNQGAPTMAAGKGYHKSYHSSVKIHQPHMSHHNPQQYSPQHRGKLRGMGTPVYLHHVCASSATMNTPPPSTANGKVSGMKSSRAPNSVTTPLTPPPTPMASGISINAESTLEETTHKFKSLNL